MATDGSSASSAGCAFSRLDAQKQLRCRCARPAPSATEATIMRIAQIAPLLESVPPQLYGGTERVVSALTEGMVARGHHVTLFASGDSRTSARLIPSVARSLRLDGHARDHVAHTITQLADVFDRAEDFDVIHSHVDYFAFPFVRRSAVPVVTTTHGRLDLPEIARVYQRFDEVPLIAISDAQRAYLPSNNWLGTVYNGIEFGRFTLRTEQGSYLAFLGRISPEKRVDRAIEVARALDMPLKIAAKVDAADQEYFDYAIRPQLVHPLIEFVGEVDERRKDEFLGDAYAYLFPIDWPEPFGLTMVESMACGTPVIAMNCGSVREVISDNVSGFICSSLREFMDAVRRVDLLERRAVRAYAEERFSASVMAAGYERLYQAMVCSCVRHDAAASVLPALVSTAAAHIGSG